VRVRELNAVALERMASKRTWWWKGQGKAGKSGKDDRLHVDGSCKRVLRLVEEGLKKLETT
jgi:hypothetical protein